MLYNTICLFPCPNYPTFGNAPARFFFAGLVRWRTVLRLYCLSSKPGWSNFLQCSLQQVKMCVSCAASSFSFGRLRQDFFRGSGMLVPGRRVVAFAWCFILLSLVCETGHPHTRAVLFRCVPLTSEKTTVPFGPPRPRVIPRWYRCADNLTEEQYY